MPLIDMLVVIPADRAWPCNGSSRRSYEMACGEQRNAAQRQDNPDKALPQWNAGYRVVGPKHEADNGDEDSDERKAEQYLALLRA